MRFEDVCRVSGAMLLDHLPCHTCPVAKPASMVVIAAVSPKELTDSIYVQPTSCGDAGSLYALSHVLNTSIPSGSQRSGTETLCARLPLQWDEEGVTCKANQVSCMGSS